MWAKLSCSKVVTSSVSLFNALHEASWWHLPAVRPRPVRQIVTLSENATNPCLKKKCHSGFRSPWKESGGLSVLSTFQVPHQQQKTVGQRFLCQPMSTFCLNTVSNYPPEFGEKTTTVIWTNAQDCCESSAARRACALTKSVGHPHMSGVESLKTLVWMIIKLLQHGLCHRLDHSNDFSTPFDPPLCLSGQAIETKGMTSSSGSVQSMTAEMVQPCTTQKGSPCTKHENLQNTNIIEPNTCRVYKHIFYASVFQSPVCCSGPLAPNWSKRAGWAKLMASRDREVRWKMSQLDPSPKLQAETILYMNRF